MAPSCKFMELCINSMFSTSREHASFSIVKANLRKIQKIFLCFVIFYCDDVLSVR